ncbi:Egg cell-secreted protein 1.4 [Forsythia ovata]|uniref:Egg cell-secreted protein 1.4 n=1 Tax=Forsythia ovata TaxID=205694 RepID=A0ABD1S8Q4_9LAMI
MAYHSNLLAILLTCLLVSTIVSPRKLESKSTLLARLKLDEEGSSSCWDALFELQSCSGEVVLFFINGETHLGQSCCDAIRIIEHQCWPSMLGSLGITTEEGNILRGYCDASNSGAGSTTPPAIPTTCPSLSP